MQFMDKISRISRRSLLLAACRRAGLLLLSCFAGMRPAAAQDGVTLPRGAAVPGFWDPRRRPDRPDLSRLQ